MNSNEIKDRASSFLERLKIYTAYAVRYIVFICRKYPLLAALFLLLYVIFIHGYLRNETYETSLLPISQQTNNAPNYAANNQINNPTSTPVVEAAQATAVRSGADLSIRWDRPVENPEIYSDKGLLESSCQPQTCTVMLSATTSELKVDWQQDGDRFTKKFKISD